MMRPFGTLRDGRTVDVITLGAADGLQAEVLTYGGILRRLTLPARHGPRDLVLSLPDLDAYVRDSAFLGVLVGRFANRIAQARFELGGRQHRLTANDGPHQLHGGTAGFGKRLWRVLAVQQSPRPQILLGLTSTDGEEGYPGNLEVTAQITVEPSELLLRFEARADATTPLSLTWHPYFNLSGDPVRPVGDQLLRLPASRYLPVIDSALIPTGEIAQVAGTPFDFRALRPLQPPALASHPQLQKGSGYDHCWVLDSGRDCDAELQSAHSGITLRLHSERPAIQFYGGQMLPGAHPGVSGLCLEPQDFPNAVNEPHFPPALLQPGETWRSAFRYRFSLSQ
jgi:aldose 1-epimerase